VSLLDEPETKSSDNRVLSFFRWHPSTFTLDSDTPVRPHRICCVSAAAAAAAVGFANSSRRPAGYGCGWRSWDRLYSELAEISLRFHIFAIPSSPPAPVHAHVCTRCVRGTAAISTDGLLSWRWSARTSARTPTCGGLWHSACERIDRPRPTDNISPRPTDKNVRPWMVLRGEEGLAPEDIGVAKKGWSARLLPRPAPSENS
jgi:hypothetical protein